jgi:hypothetical protein
MARGVSCMRGRRRQERNQALEEADAGTLTMPREPRTRTSSQGRYDATTNTVTKAYRRYVVYIPYATAQSTGLSTMPVPAARG